MATVVSKPLAALTPASRDFGTVVTGRSAAASFAITNSGGSTLTGQVSVAEQGFAISNGTNFTLNAGQSRSISVSFIPAAAGSYSGVVLITTSDQILTGLVSGVGFDGPILGISPSSIDLGPVANNLSSDAVFVVTNSGSQLLTGSAVAEGDPFAIAGSDVYELLPGGSTQIVVRFAPISPEFYTNRIEFLSDGGSATGLVTGIGSNLPVMVVSPVSYDYGSIVTGTQVSATFTVSNRGMAVMNSGEVSVPGPAFQITGGANFSDMVEGDDHTVTIRFAPLALQTYSNLATFESNAGLIQIPLIGQGVSLDIPALLGVSPAAYDFGSIAALSSSQALFVVTNSGTLAMTGTASLVSSTFTIVSGSSFIVSGGGSTNVVVQFTPGYAGSYTADLIFESSGGGFTGALSGAGFLPSGGSTNLFYGVTGGVFNLVFPLPAGTG